MRRPLASTKSSQSAQPVFGGQPYHSQLCTTLAPACHNQPDQLDMTAVIVSDTAAWVQGVVSGRQPCDRVPCRDCPAPLAYPRAGQKQVDQPGPLGGPLWGLLPLPVLPGPQPQPPHQSDSAAPPASPEGAHCLRQ